MNVFGWPDCDGLTWRDPRSSEVWIVFHGVRHRIADRSVYDALFPATGHPTAAQDLSHIPAGSELDESTCLVRVRGSSQIFLLMAEKERLRRHFIPTRTSFEGFGFDDSKVLNLPRLLVESLERGRDISTHDGRRAARSPDYFKIPDVNAFSENAAYVPFSSSGPDRPRVPITGFDGIVELGFRLDEVTAPQQVVNLEIWKEADDFTNQATFSKEEGTLADGAARVVPWRQGQRIVVQGWVNSSTDFQPRTFKAKLTVTNESLDGVVLDVVQISVTSL